VVELVGPLNEKQLRDALEDKLKTFLYDTTEGKSAATLLREVRDGLRDIRGTISVNNFPTDYPDSVARAWLGSIYSRLYDVKGSIEVTNFPTDFPDSVARAWLGSIFDRQLKVAETIDAGTVYVGTAETLILSADADRLDLAIYNAGPGTIYIGPSGKLFYPIPPDGQIAMSYRGALYGSADQPNTLVRYLALRL